MIQDHSNMYDDKEIPINKYVNIIFFRQVDHTSIRVQPVYE